MRVRSPRLVNQRLKHVYSLQDLTADTPRVLWLLTRASLEGTIGFLFMYVSPAYHDFLHPALQHCEPHFFECALPAASAEAAPERETGDCGPRRTKFASSHIQQLPEPGAPLSPLLLRLCFLPHPTRSKEGTRQPCKKPASSFGFGAGWPGQAL